jgi:hypothetical protein
VVPPAPDKNPVAVNGDLTLLSESFHHGHKLVLVSAGAPGGLADMDRKEPDRRSFRTGQEVRQQELVFDTLVLPPRRSPESSPQHGASRLTLYLAHGVSPSEPRLP